MAVGSRSWRSGFLAGPPRAPRSPHPTRPSPIEPLLQDPDAEHGLRAVAQVQVFVLGGQGHLVLLVPLLFLLQLLGLLRAGRGERGRGDAGWPSPGVLG